MGPEGFDHDSRLALLATKGIHVTIEPMPTSEDEWKSRLDPDQFHVLREAGTEPAFTGKFWNAKDDGTYVCAGCETELFSSDTKFDSGTGWPSFWQPLDDSRVELVSDKNHGMVRTEVRCATCHGHLGHVFNDGPTPTGSRFCMNSASLDFRSAE